MRMESGPDSAYTRTWSPSGEIEYAEQADGTRLRYLKEGSGPTVLIVLHTVRTQLDHFQLVIPKISHAFTVYAIDMPGMGWSDITPGASYTEPALRRAIVEFVTTLDLNDVTLAGESMGATVSLTASTELVDRVRRVVAFNTYDYSKGVGRANRVASIYVGSARLPAIGRDRWLEQSEVSAVRSDRVVDDYDSAARRDLLRRRRSLCPRDGAAAAAGIRGPLSRAGTLGGTAPAEAHASHFQPSADYSRGARLA
jgi:pimeloyl-ACP methyl ester carboxylesterase